MLSLTSPPAHALQDCEFAGKYITYAGSHEHGALAALSATAN